MQMSDFITVFISAFALATSIVSAVYNFVYQRRQTKIMQKQLDEQTRHKFTDDPHNAYTTKLGNISDNLMAIAQQIHELRRECKDKCND